MSASVEQIVGDLQARVANLEKASDRIETKLDEAISTLNSAKGGWRMLLVIGTVFAGIASFIVTVAATVHGWFGK